MDAMTNALQLTVRVAHDRGMEGWHELTILVDGRDLFDEAWGGNGQGP